MPKDAVQSILSPITERRPHSINIKLDEKTACTALCRKTVLICDDVSFNLMPLATMLQVEWNIESESFLEGKQAVECFKQSL